MSDTVKTFVAGVVGIALVATVGMHASGLATATTATGKAGSGLIRTAQA